MDVAECVETVETVETGGWEEGSAGEDSRTVRALAAGSFPAITRMSSASDASKESSIGYNVETWKRGNREGGKGAERRAVGRGNGGKRREIDALEEGMALRSIEFAARTSSSAVLVAPSRFCGVLARSRRMRSYVRRFLAGLRARIPPQTRGTPWIRVQMRRFSRRSGSYASSRALSPTHSLLRTARIP